MRAPPPRANPPRRGGAYAALSRAVAAAALLCAASAQAPASYEHYVSSSAATGGQVADSGTSSSKLITALTGAAVPVPGGISFDGQPSSGGEVNGVTLVSLAALRGAVVITVTAQYAPVNTTAAGDFSDDAYRHLFNLGGISAVIHRDELWVANAAGGSAACSAGADLTGRLGGPVWPAHTLRTLEVEISFLGVPRIKINGLNADYPRPRPAEEEVAHPAPACRMAAIPAASMLFLGASGNPFFNDNFAGVIASLGFTFTPPATDSTPREEEVVPPPVTAPPPAVVLHAHPMCHPVHHFCVAEERESAELRSVFCYGATNGCLWNSGACAQDSDCEQYTSSSAQKFTDGANWPAASYCADPPAANDWPFAACGYVLTAPPPCGLHGVLTAEQQCVTAPGYYISEGDPISRTSASQPALCFPGATCAGGQPFGVPGGAACPTGERFNRRTTQTFSSKWNIVFDASAQSVTSIYGGWLDSGSAPFADFQGPATTVTLSGGRTDGGCSPRTTALRLSYPAAGENHVAEVGDETGTCDYWVSLALATPLFDECVGISPPPPPPPSPSPPPPPPPPPSSCAAILAANAAAADGVYDITLASGGVASTLCDMAAGGWTKVFTIPTTPGSSGPSPLVTTAVSTPLLTQSAQFAKLSDDDITALAHPNDGGGSAGRFWVKCVAVADGALAESMYVSNSQQRWDSRIWQQSGLDWKADVNRDGVADCVALRTISSGFTFSTYSQPQLTAQCANNHFNWGSDGAGAGCYVPAYGWGGTRGEVWVGPPAPAPPPPSPSPPPPSPPPSPPPTPSAVADWAARVSAAGSGVSPAVLAAHSRFYASLDAAGLLPKLARVNTFSGNDLSAALVPLLRGGGYASEMRSEATSRVWEDGVGLPSFAATLSQSGGLARTDGFLLTGQRMSHANLMDTSSAFNDGTTVHMGLYMLSNLPSVRPMGVYRSSVWTRHYLLSASVHSSWGTQQPVPSGYGAPGLHVGSGGPGGAGVTAHCPAAAASASCTTRTIGTDFSTPSDHPVALFAAAGSATGVSTEQGLFHGLSTDAARVGGYSIGYALTVADVAALNAAWRALNAELGRS
jgi:hypothetical protein